MKQDPEYLKNQSKHVHRLHRRNQRFLRYFLILWLSLFGALALAATLDVLVSLKWGLTNRDVWSAIGMMAGGGVIWLFGRAIMSITLGMARRVYGPEPDDPPI
jgi:hypothetical protein